LINEVGIYVHKRDKDSHTTPLLQLSDFGPETWTLLPELDDDIDEANVLRILTDIG
jgi:hypothetical protein